jgi:hypothetical protein
MATHIKIKTNEDNHIHFDTHMNNYTLCGLETGGDKGLNISIAIPTRGKVNCPECIRIVKFCHDIEKSEWK